VAVKMVMVVVVVVVVVAAAAVVVIVIIIVVVVVVVETAITAADLKDYLLTQQKNSSAQNTWLFVTSCIFIKCSF
jgi:hypothetical protein